MTLDEIRSYFTTDLSERIALNIVELLETSANDENLEVDFRLSRGKMVGSLDGPNTWFQCDATPGTELEQVKTELGKIFAEDFDEDDEVEANRIKEQVNLIQSFIESVRMVLNSGIYHDRIAKAIRKTALQDVPAALVPIHVLQFLDIEIGEIDKNEYLLAIEKLPKVDAITGQFIEPPQSVNADLFETHKATGKSFEEIVEMRKAEGDSRYDAVAGVVKRRYSYELHCRIAADYSFCDIPVNAQP